MITTIGIGVILSFPLAFVIHDAEEVVIQHRWLLSHKDKLFSHLPKFRPLILYLEKLTTKSFAIAAIEEFILIVGSCLYLILRGSYSMEIWIALFMAFCVHLLVHIAQAIVVRGYVPGLVSTLVLLPYAVTVLWLLYSSVPLSSLFPLTIVGVLIMAFNLWLSHLIG